jgi:hypothetical protein
LCLLRLRRASNPTNRCVHVPPNPTLLPQPPPPQIPGARGKLALTLVVDESRLQAPDLCPPPDHRTWHEIVSCLRRRPDGRMAQEVLRAATKALLDDRNKTPEEVRAAFRVNALSRYRANGEYWCASLVAPQQQAPQPACGHPEAPAATPAPQSVLEQAPSAQQPQQHPGTALGKTWGEWLWPTKGGSSKQQAPEEGGGQLELMEPTLAEIRAWWGFLDPALVFDWLGPRLRACVRTLGGGEESLGIA